MFPLAPAAKSVEAFRHAATVVALLGSGAFLNQRPQRAVDYAARLAVSV